MLESYVVNIYINFLFPYGIPSFKTIDCLPLWLFQKKSYSISKFIFQNEWSVLYFFVIFQNIFVIGNYSRVNFVFKKHCVK